MTLRSAERITGYTIVCIGDDSGGKYRALQGYAAFNGDVEIARVLGPGKKIGPLLKQLVEKVYKIHSKIVLEKQKYRCLLCGGRFPLDIDHIKPRSKGRDDRVENLRAICSAFYGCRAHARKHGG